MEENEEKEEVVEEEEKEEVEDVEEKGEGGGEFLKSSYIYIPVILALVVVFFVLVRARSMRQPAVNIETTPPPVTQEVSSRDQLFADDVISDNTLTVESVYLNNNGFIVVRDEEGGEPGEIIGVSQLLPKGGSSLLQIEMDRKVVEGETLYLMIMVDDGNGEFSEDYDVPAMDEYSNPMIEELVVNLADEVVEEEELSPTPGL